MIATVYPAFDGEAFLRTALDGYEPIELMPRGRHIARALHRHLPDDYPTAIDLLIASLGPKLEGTESFGMSPFLYLPHVFLWPTTGWITSSPPSAPSTKSPSGSRPNIASASPLGSRRR